MIAHLDAVTSISVHSSGLYLASGSHDQSLRFWDIASKKCLASLDPHQTHRKKFDEVFVVVYNLLMLNAAFVFVLMPFIVLFQFPMYSPYTALCIIHLCPYLQAEVPMVCAKYINRQRKSLLS